MIFIQINPRTESFTFTFEDLVQEVTFESVLNSESWLTNKTISIVHDSVTEYGTHPVTCLNREAFTGKITTGAEEYYRANGLWDYATAIHKLYAILDGKTEEEAELEVTNLSTQRDIVDAQKREWNNDMVVRFAAAEEIGDKEAMKAIKAEKCPIISSQEMKKLLFAARDESKPSLKLSNVTPEEVKKAYKGKLNVV